MVQSVWLPAASRVTTFLKITELNNLTKLMTYINLPDNRDRRLVFYLAMEEYVAGNLDKLLGDVPHKDAFFMWQVKPTVIVGRN